MSKRGTQKRDRKNPNETRGRKNRETGLHPPHIYSLANSVKRSAIRIFYICVHSSLVLRAQQTVLLQTHLDQTSNNSPIYELYLATSCTKPYFSLSRFYVYVGAENLGRTEILLQIAAVNIFGLLSRIQSWKRQNHFEAQCLTLHNYPTLAQLKVGLWANPQVMVMLLVSCFLSLQYPSPILSLPFIFHTHTHSFCTSLLTCFYPGIRKQLTPKFMCIRSPRSICLKYHYWNADMTPYG